MTMAAATAVQPRLGAQILRKELERDDDRLFLIVDRLPVDAEHLAAADRQATQLAADVDLPRAAQVGRYGGRRGATPLRIVTIRGPLRIPAGGVGMSQLVGVRSAPLQPSSAGLAVRGALAVDGTAFEVTGEGVEAFGEHKDPYFDAFVDDHYW